MIVALLRITKKLGLEVAVSLGMTRLQKGKAMNSRLSTIASATILAAVTGLLALPGCNQEGSEVLTPDAKVDVPEIPASVAADEFCALADEIYCAGAVGCCSGADIVFATVEECLATSRCSSGLAGVLASAQMQGSELSYDATKAGDYLRTLASAVSQCGEHPVAVTKPVFFVGTRDAGADCTPQGKDLTNSFTCKPGLTCVESIDPMTNESQSTCMDVAPVEPLLAVGAACASGEDCGTGLCKEGACAVDVSAEYCIAPPEEIVPSNADPTHLYIDLSGDNSGTSGDVTIRYLNNGKYWGCTITDTLSDGQEKVCVVDQTGTVSNSNKEYFTMEMNSSDGVRIDTICACSAANTSTNKCSTAIECAGTFNDYGDRANWCTGGSFNLGLWAYGCSSVWLDNDGHGSCTKHQVNSYDDNYTYCVD